jgi:hypothetical protein
MAALAAILFALPTAQAAEMEIVVWAPADQNEPYRFEAVALAANVSDPVYVKLFNFQSSI